jgi:hypothetical protein
VRDLYPRLTPFRPRAVKTTPVTVALVPDTAHRARADSVGQRQVEVWSSHIVHRDDREVLCIFLHDRSSQDSLVRGTHFFDSVIVPRATLLLLDDPVVRLVETAGHPANTTEALACLSFRTSAIVDFPEVWGRRSLLRCSTTRHSETVQTAGFAVSARLREEDVRDGNGITEGSRLLLSELYSLVYPIRRNREGCATDASSGRVLH